MKRLATLLVLSALCSAGVAHGTSPSGLRGLVKRGPITPVCIADVPCDSPAANTRLLFFRSGAQVSSVQTSATGTYRVTLAPGEYGVRIARKSGVGRKIEPSTVRVVRGRVLRVNFSIDTGIR